MVGLSNIPRTPKIGPYQLLARIGKGGMSTAYLAKADGLAGFNKLAVLKVLHSDLARCNEFVEMFFNEASLAARLTHPNVVHTYGAGEDKGRLYIAMEYLDGHPWSRVQRRLRSRGVLPSLSVNLRVIADTLAGLHYAHELRDYDGGSLQVVHCDVSPQNIFVTYDGQIKVVDFGVARAANSSRLPSGSLFVGKPAYCSPEQALGQKPDRRADVFSVGVILWEQLANRRFALGAEISNTFRHRIAGEEPRIREVQPDVPLALADICDRALALDPEDRFATAAEFRKQIQDFLFANALAADDSQIAVLVNQSFKEEHERIHNLIERRLKNSSFHPKPVEDLIDNGTLDDATEDTHRVDLSELVSLSKLENEYAVAEASIRATIRPWKKRRPMGRVAGAVAAGIALVYGAWILLYMTHPTMPESASLLSRLAVINPLNPAAYLGVSSGKTESAAAASSVRVEAATRAKKSASKVLDMVELNLAATPQEAVFYLDGLRLANNPVTQIVPRDNRPHRIVATAAGYVTQEVVVTPDRKRSVALTLTPSSRSSERRQNRRGQGAKRDETERTVSSEPMITAQTQSKTPSAVDPSQAEAPSTASTVDSASPREPAQNKSQEPTPAPDGKADFGEGLKPTKPALLGIDEEDPF
jgi:serine/threonine protein kinase